MDFEAGATICALASLVLLAGLVWLFVNRRRESSGHEAEARRALDRRIREISARVVSLERDVAALRGAPLAQPSASEPAAPSERDPAASWAEGIRSASAAGAPSAPVETALPTQDAPPHDSPPAHTEPPRTAPRAQPSFESFVGGRVMLVAGVVVVLFGVGFFLKFAIDREWIGPATRIAMCVTAGLALLVGGDRLRGRGLRAFGQALMGSGLGALYLSNYFTFKRYEFIDQTTAFVLTSVLTGTGAALAIRRSAPLLAYLGFFGGYLAPAVLADASGSLPGLATWLLLVDAGLLAVLLCRVWPGIDLMALAFTAFYFTAWLLEHSATAAAQLGMVCGCLASLVGSCLLMALLPSIVRRTVASPSSLLTAAVAGMFGAIAGHDLLFPDHRVALGAAILAVGALYLLASRLSLRAGDAAKPAAQSLAAFAVAALAIAIATVASGAAVALALSIAGLAVVYAGTRTRQGALAADGVAMILFAFGDLVVNRLEMFDHDYSPFWNERFLVFACPCAAMLAAGALLARSSVATGGTATLVGTLGLWPLAIVMASDLRAGIIGSDDLHREMRVVAPAALLGAYAFASARLFGRGSAAGRLCGLAPLLLAISVGVRLLVHGHVSAFLPFASPAFGAGLVVVAACAFAEDATEPGWRAASRIAALVYLFGLITAEIGAWGEHRPLDGGTRPEAQFAAIVWISIAWAIYGAALVAAGFRWDKASLRWMGLGVFAITLGKVFLVDMAQLDAVYRIGSFLVLGALLVAASFLYQRSRGEAPPQR